MLVDYTLQRNATCCCLRRRIVSEKSSLVERSDPACLVNCSPLATFTAINHRRWADIVLVSFTRRVISLTANRSHLSNDRKSYDDHLGWGGGGGDGIFVAGTIVGLGRKAVMNANIYYS
jgi:hypothetical protein